MTEKKPEGYYNQLVAKVKEGYPAIVEAVKKQMGAHPGQEKISTEEQLQAYRELTPQDMMVMRQQKGERGFADYIWDMEAKLRRRGNA